MKARLLSIALAICMALSLTPVAYAMEGDTTGGAGGTTSATETSVAKIGDQYYDTLVAAVQAASSGQTIELLKNASGAGIGTFLGDPTDPVKDFTIDFGRHTYTCVGPAVGSTGTQSQAFHLEWAGNGQENAQVTLKNGTVTSDANSGVWMLVQNYCNLTLDGVTLNGANIGAGGYALSNNCGNVTIKDSTIIAPQGGYAFDSCDYDSYTGVTVTVEGDSRIQGAIEHTNPNGDENNAQLIVKGGTFTENTVGIDNGASKPLQSYVAEGYTLAAAEGSWTVKALGEDGGMAVKPTTSEDGSVSATLEGEYAGASTTVEDGNDGSETGASNGNVTVDLSSAEGSEEATGATLTMPANTAKSLASATSLTLKSDVGDVTLNDVALRKIGAEGLNPVTVSIEKATVGGDKVKAAYTVEVKANDQNLLPPGAYDNGLVTIAVPKPAGVENLQAWYVVQKDNSLVYVNQLPTIDLVGGILSIKIEHLSTIVLTDGTPDNQAVANVIGSNQEITPYASLEDALGAVAESGGTIELLKDATMTQGVTFKNDVTIKGNEHTITGDENDASVNFKVENNGKLTISDVTLEGFGSNAGTDSGIAVVKVGSGKTNTKVVATNVNVINFCRSAYDIRSGEFEITGGMIDCGDAGTGTNSRLTKGILAGLGTGQVSGGVYGTTITNSSSNYSEWSSAGIEIYQNANVTMNGVQIANVQNGVSADNYYAANGGNNTGAVVKIEATSINATGNAIRVYGDGEDGDIGTTANVTVDGGDYVGDIAIINGTTSNDSSAKKEIISISQASIAGDIDNANGVMSFVSCGITNENGITDPIAGVTFINTTVNGETVSTDTEGNVALLNGTLYETLQAAVEAAKAGDTITILPGTHELAENTTITLDKKITIQGATNSERERAVIKCKGTNASGHGLFTLAEGSEGSVLDNFDISYTATGSDCAAIYLSAGFGGEGSETTLIQSMNIAGDGSAANEQAIGILSTYGAEGPLVVVANTFSSLKYGMYFNQITDLTVENNTIDNTRYNAINIAADSETYPCSNITIAQNTLTNISSANHDNTVYSSGINVGAQTEGVKVEGNSISMLNGKKPINVVQPSGDQDAKSAVITYQVNGADYAIFVAEIQSGTAAYVPPQEPEVPGYAFEGWDYGDATVTIDKNANVATVNASHKQTFTFMAILKPVSSGGPGGGGVTTPSYDVTIAQPEGGTVSVDPTDAEAGEEVTVTVKPDEGLTLGDLIVTDEDGNTVKVAANEDGTYSFEMPEGDVTITATFVCDGGALCPTDKFTDIDQAQWYHFAIDWVVENGVMKGIGGTTLFAPDDDLLREQAATVMWNIMAEGDLEAPAAALSDVAQGEWYAPYVNWAVEATVMEGHGGTDRFGVGEALTREQFAAVVAKATKADVSAADATALEGFTDSESVSEWAQATMAWAVEAGVINGVALSDGTLELQGSREITRAEMAMMIKNAVDEGVLEL
jgi:hypothetical protein